VLEVAWLMVSRYHRLAIYSVLLAGAAAWWLSRSLVGVHDAPPTWVAAALIAACLFVWQFGVPVPRVGLTSMERVPQIGMLLVFSPPVAAAICAAGSVLWPLISPRYSHGSARAAAVRAVHNAAMTALMLLLAGDVYLALGGRHPLGVPSLDDLLPLAAMAVTAQLVNVALLAVYFRLDGREVRRIIRPIYTIVDLVFVPAGVLAAVLYNTAAPATFALFVLLLALLVVSFNGIGGALTTADTESSPLARLSRARRALHGARQIDELGERILSETRALFRFDEFHLVLADHEQRTLDVRTHERRGERQPVQRKALSSGLFGWVVERAEPVLVEDWARAPAHLRERADPPGTEVGSLLIVPLRDAGRAIGLLSVQHAQAGIYSDADLHLMQGLAEQVAPAVADARAFEDLESYRKDLEQRVAERTDALQRANQEKERLIAALGERSRTLERESQEDPLTGIANRRSFTRRLAAEIELSLAVGQPLTLALADLDHFKIVNDRLGHVVGDAVLRHSAAMMQRHCRTDDFAARIGGEEFALILPGTDHADAVAFCESLRNTIETFDWQALHEHLRVTLSIGIAQWDGSASADEFVRTADIQLYRAKREGRNRVA
jgi:diguanylate cyclase (GGDEF)-like protein